jgi:hypothetical protein
MNRTQFLALIAAVVAAFVASSLLYSPLIFGKQFLELSGAGLNPDHAGAKIAGEIFRNIVLACVVARLILLLKPSDWKHALGLGALLWIGFPVLLLSGSVMWQNVPWMLAVIHAGDWFVKLLLMTAILGLIRERTEAKALAQKPA